MTDGPVTPLALLRRWLDRQFPGEAGSWLRQQIEKVSDGGGGAADRNLYLAVGLVPRRIGKDDLRLDDGDLADAAAARRGWDPRGWSVDQAARVALLLASFDGDEAAFARRFEQLCRTADVGELVSLYRGLPLYPGQERYVARAGEGARSNMRAVFEAVAHRSPYPAERFPENAWNHMVLKALFVGSRLHPIQGLDERANPQLARMLCDYAHERWAAGRPVSPELWRCVGPHADGAALADLERALTTGGATERKAAALALAACPAPGAEELLRRSAPDLAAAVERGELSWDTVAREI